MSRSKVAMQRFVRTLLPDHAATKYAGGFYEVRRPDRMARLPFADVDALVSRGVLIAEGESVHAAPEARAWLTRSRSAALPFLAQNADLTPHQDGAMLNLRWRGWPRPVRRAPRRSSTGTTWRRASASGGSPSGRRWCRGQRSPTTRRAPPPARGRHRAASPTARLTPGASSTGCSTPCRATAPAWCSTSAACSRACRRWKPNAAGPAAAPRSSCASGSNRRPWPWG